jgi:predicted esterase
MGTELSNRRVARCVVVALLVSLVSLITAPAPSAEAAACPDVYILGVKGSGENAGNDPTQYQNMGQTVDAAERRLASGLASSGRTVKASGLAYEAASVPFAIGTAIFNTYENSVADGVTKARGQLESWASACPQAMIVLLGYSQGADVITRVLQSGSMSTLKVDLNVRLAGVGFFGDPQLNPAATTLQVAGGYDHSLYGLDKGSYSGTC